MFFKNLFPLLGWRKLFSTAINLVFLISRTIMNRFLTRLQNFMIETCFLIYALVYRFLFSELCRVRTKYSWILISFTVHFTSLFLESDLIRVINEIRCNYSIVQSHNSHKPSHMDRREWNGTSFVWIWFTSDVSLSALLLPRVVQFCVGINCNIRWSLLWRCARIANTSLCFT